MTKMRKKWKREAERIGHQVENVTKKAVEDAEALARQAQIQAQQLLETQRKLSALEVAAVAVPVILHAPTLSTVVVPVILSTLSVEPPRKLSI